MEGKKNYSWAAFLIIIGIVLLLNTTNVIGWGIWLYAYRFWPVLVVLLGLRIILGGSLVARILQMIFTIVLTGGVFLVSYIQYTEKPLEFLPSKINNWVLEGGQGIFNLAVETVEGEYSVSSSEFESTQKGELNFDLSASSFTIKEEDIDDLIYVNALYPKTYDEPELNATQQEDLLNIEFKSASANSVYLFSNKSEYDITIDKQEIPYDINLKLGAGQGEMVLEEIPVEDFYTDIGAGKMEVSLGVNSIPTGDVRITVGAGKMKLILPSRVGYQIEYDLGVGNIQVDGEEVSGLSAGRGKLTSDNYNDTDLLLNMYITVGVGTFEISRE
jgi:hypothetical protein